MEKLYLANTILCIYGNPVLGDFLHIMFPIIFNIKCKNPKAIVDFKCSSNNTSVQLLAKKMDILNYNVIQKIKYDFVLCLSEANEHSNIEHTDVFYLTKLAKQERFDYISTISDKNFRQKILAYFRQTFHSNSTAPAGIVINIGSTCHNGNPVNNNELFQDRMATVILENLGEKFTLVGRKYELVSEKLKALLLKPQVRICIRNFLDKTENVLELCTLLFNCKLVIVRNTGVMHLAGLCNCNLITLTTRHSILSQYKILFGQLKNVQVYVKEQYKESEHPYYNDKWAPLSDTIIDVVEFKGFNQRYNDSIPEIISHHIHSYIENPAFNSKKIRLGGIKFHI